MRGKIYFEIFEYTLCGNTISVWNSWPKDYNDEYWSMKWNSLNVGWIFNVLMGRCRKKNGPRYWTIDEALDCNNKKLSKKTVGLFSFMKRAEIDKNSIKTAITNSTLKAYYSISINRNTIWIYNKDSLIYYLTDSKNNIWILQSMLVPTFQLMDSKKDYLQKVPNMPKGWMYTIYKTPKSISIPSVNGVAYIIRDEIGNTFMNVDSSLEIYKPLLAV